MESKVLLEVILILNWSLFSCASTAEKQLNLLVLEPIPNPPLPVFYHPSYAEGPALFLAAKLAAKIVNNNSSILQGYRLNLLRKDSGCSVPFRAMDAFARSLLRSKRDQVSPIVGVIGPTCSLSALTVSSLSGRSEVALINIPLAGTHKLQDRKRHPYSFSILDSSRLIARAIVALTQSNNWEKVALFYDISRQYFLSVVEAVGEETNHTVEPVGVSLTDLSPLHSVQNKFRIIILLVARELLSGIMCFAHTEGYTYPAYQYIISTEVIEAVDKVKFKVGSKSYHCERDEVRSTLNGSLLVKHQVERPVNELDMGTESGISLQQFKEMYNESFYSSDLLRSNESMPSIFGAIVYDAVWSFVLALDAAMNNTDIESYSFGQPNVTNLIAEKLVGYAFEGLSGRIQFNNTTGHIDQNAQYFVINEVDTTELSYYNKMSNNITFYNQLAMPEAIFIRDSFKKVILTVPKQLTYFILILNGFSFILTMVLNISTWIYRHVDSVKATSTKLIQVAFVGCYIHALSLLFAVLIYGFSDSISDHAVCKIQHFLDFSLSIGLTVLLGVICMRMWRLHRIFNRFLNPGKLLSDKYLILSTASLVCIDLALTVPAFFYSKYEPMAEEERANNVIWKIKTCKRSQTTDFFLWFMSSLAVSAVLLSGIFILAVLTRKIPQRNFKTTSIMCLSYTLTAVVPFTIGVYFTFSSLSGYISMILRFCSLCILLFCLILIPCAMLFFPPLLPILKQKKRTISKTFKRHTSFTVSFLPDLPNH